MTTIAITPKTMRPGIEKLGRSGFAISLTMQVTHHSLNRHETCMSHCTRLRFAQRRSMSFGLYMAGFIV
jgi:hypothetical protein